MDKESEILIRSMQRTGGPRNRRGTEGPLKKCLSKELMTLKSESIYRFNMIPMFLVINGLDTEILRLILEV